MTEERGTILVVDDNATKRYVISSWLRRAGHRIVEAATGAEALARVREQPTDLVVLDVRLPDLSGYEICERIKAAPDTSSLPVVHISATAVEVSDRTQGLTRGADAYLAEPIDPEEMLATVHALLRYFRARQRAERLANRLAQLVEQTLAVNAASTFEGLLKRAAAGAAVIFDRPAAAGALDQDGRPMLACCPEPGRPASVREWAGYPVRAGDDAEPGTELRTESGRDWPDLGRYDPDRALWVTVARPATAPRPAYVVVPLDGLGPDDANVLTQLGQAVALAVEAMRSHDEERRIALTLQHSLLPRVVPRLDGVDLAVRYVPASERAAIGGDFYELMALEHVLVGAIGDVAGHSLHAATVMGELRHVLRAYLIEGHQPGAVIDRLNGLMLRLLPEETATMCLLALDRRSGGLRFANAGHLPPLVSGPGAGARFLEGGGPLLGVPGGGSEEIGGELPPGATLVLVTDGLIERRDRSISDSLAELRQAAGQVEPDLEAFCDRLLGTFITGPTDDDVAIVAIRRTA